MHAALAAGTGAAVVLLQHNICGQLLKDVGCSLPCFQANAR